MKTVAIPIEPVEVTYPYDCERIQKILYDRGYDITLHTAEKVWMQYSSAKLVSWLNLPEDDDRIYNIVMNRVEVVDEH